MIIAHPRLTLVLNWTSAGNFWKVILPAHPLHWVLSKQIEKLLLIEIIKNLVEQAELIMQVKGARNYCVWVSSQIKAIFDNLM
jgi:hypothetical protein